MKYILDNKNSVIKSIKENELNALSIKPSKGYQSVIQTNRILLVDPKFKDAYIKQKIDKKINSLLMKMQCILESDEDTTGNIEIVLDEIQRLKSIIINKYKEYLTNEQYKEMLRSIIILEEDFKRRYNAKLIYRELMMEQIEEARGKGR